MFTCPVCGWDRIEEDPMGRTFEICPCCGTEYGYQDAGRTHAELRQDWIEDGMAWWSCVRAAPDGWNPQEQLKRVTEGEG
jgi:hypothetical protein